MCLQFKFCENPLSDFWDSTRKRFFTKDKKNKLSNEQFCILKKKKHFSNIVFAYIAHFKFQKASFNRNWDMKQNVSRDGDGTQNNTGWEVKTTTKQYDLLHNTSC